MVGLLAAAGIMAATLLVGLRGVAAVRTTSDFLVASRRTSPLVNSSAVAGEYLSAGSFVGAAGLMVKDGVGSLWYLVGFAAGYVTMLVLVAAPMRRSGALTVPDFAEARLGSAGLRRLSAVVVLVISTLYLVPQFRAAGLVLSVVSPVPYWVGIVLAAGAVSITLALGGMRAATYVQAFQFVLKMVLFAIPAIWLVVAVGAAVRTQALHPVEFDRFPRETTLVFRDRVTVETAAPVRVDGELLAPGTHSFHGGQRVIFPAGTPTPRVGALEPPGGTAWQRPLFDIGHHGYPLFSTLAVLFATALGTMGLPHMIMRFHTSPDGRAARRTAALTIPLIGLFYLFPAIYGALGGVLVPQLYLSGDTDTVVVALPSQVDSGWQGTLFTGLLTAGCFAAIMTSSLGLLLAGASAISHDLGAGGLGRLRLSVLGSAAAVLLLSLPAARLDAGILVTWAFTVAASTFSPLLVLSIWWSRLTAFGALAGILVGLLVSSTAIGVTVGVPNLSGWAAVLANQPAPLSVPAAFLTMTVVSLRGRPTPWALSAMLRLHVDENDRSSRTSGRSRTVRRRR
ncbi:sodium/solute symporter [Nocardia sp. CDC160]|uniref:sodium/solute symporter n=1 Tax=Nocardia sp. CDC160 TaxID=3112166 RepID=UPI002DC0489E|nr:cation acetate symporter [Nocardia sp. CDC160]MEC3915789.1 cation acetate symporter [Nocardia sp. CDC160]